jgi:predicted Fe-Mo cluster-binding NifX family protein
MKIALTSWNGRISPVFDVSRTIRVLEIVNKHILTEEEYVLPVDDLSAKIAKLVQLEVDTLICGAISRSLAGMALAHGIRLISFVAGEVKDVISACLDDNLPNPALAMPGCYGRQKRFGHEWCPKQKNEPDMKRSEIMPRGDGTGPRGQGPRTGAGRGSCGAGKCGRGQGIGKGRNGGQGNVVDGNTGQGRGRGKNK